MSGFTHEPGAGGTPEWYTPPWLFNALGIGFDLDPCAPPSPRAPWIPAERRISPPRDGLAAPWAGRVWLNPPYGPVTGLWLGKLASHGDGIALVFARVDTAWAQAAIRAATVVCFPTGRVEFVPGPGAVTRRSDGRSRSGSPSMLLAFGPDCAQALSTSGIGLVVAPVMSVAAPQLEVGA